jgi:hypothetical protein
MRVFPFADKVEVHAQIIVVGKGDTDAVVTGISHDKGGMGVLGALDNVQPGCPVLDALTQCVERLRAAKRRGSA